MPVGPLTWYARCPMSTATPRDFVSLNSVADLSRLRPWLPREVRDAVGEQGAPSDGDAAPRPHLPDPAAASAALHACDRVVSALFDESPISVAVSAPDGRLLRVNRAFAALLGCEPARLTERTLEELMHPDDAVACGERRQELAEGIRDTFATEVRFILANRTELWTRVCARLHRSRDDEAPEILVHVVEIPEPTHVQEERQRRLESLLLSSWGPSSL